MLPLTTNSNPSGPTAASPTEPLSHSTTLPLESLSPQDQGRLSLLFRTRGDAVSFASLREEDPLETLTWLAQPHIKPWHALIQAAHRDHEQTETRLALARALKDITRILDLEADSTLRIRAVNAVIKLANAIHRAGAHPSVATPPIPAAPRSAPSSPLKGASDGCQGSRSSASAPLVAALLNPPHPSGVREAIELNRATDNAQAAALQLKAHLDRRALRNDDLQDAKAPRGTPPTPLPNPPPNRIAGLDRTTDTPPLTLLSAARPTPAHLNGKHNAAHSSGHISARAGTPRPPPRRKRKHR